MAYECYQSTHLTPVTYYLHLFYSWERNNILSHWLSINLRIPAKGKNCSIWRSGENKSLVVFWKRSAEVKVFIVLFPEKTEESVVPRNAPKTILLMFKCQSLRGAVIIKTLWVFVSFQYKYLSWYCSFFLSFYLFIFCFLFLKMFTQG